MAELYCLLPETDRGTFRPYLVFENLKPKELFKLMSLKESEINSDIDKWLTTNFNTLLPEEVAMTLRMSDG
jgi:hypothetical protein